MTEKLTSGTVPVVVSGAGITVSGLRKSFGPVEVLQGIDLEVAPGEIVSLIGPSGSGKSTILRCLNKLEEPTSGTVVVNGFDIMDAKVDINEVRRSVGMVFQHFNLFPNMSVIENVMLAPVETGKRGKEEARKQALALLRRVGLEEKADARPSQLSGGQKQRVAIARALAMEPAILLFDEATSALDPEMVGEVLEVIRELAKTGITMVLVTHEMGFAREVCDKVVFLADGVVCEEGEPEQVFGNPQTPRLQEFLSKVL
ncbi:ATP-binding cassette domain-containing protein [Leucobacter sp. gxy201]|uniref:amino acid ABC transporter ATP-binding protein n=1 Tax=Leucobacter sp. gxy201 TaxID=2957200 RepID=UPI003DA177FA